ncbi:agarase [Agaribacterium sp. ZY112]|uniref:agarase n=1 Tax=Agaribacterium sp. ZY112 TaxID=3233574 RepID=UPI0035256D20
MTAITKRVLTALAIVSIPATALIFSACSGKETAKTVQVASHKKQATLLDFESGEDSKSVSLSHATAKIIKNASGHAYDIHLASSEVDTASFSLKPVKPWDFSQVEHPSLAVDLYNPQSTSTHIYIYVYDSAGNFHLRNVVVPAESDLSYLIELDVPALQVNTGMRNNPASWQGDYVQTIWRGGNKEGLDTSAITEVAIKVMAVPDDKRLILDNVRVLSQQFVEEHYLHGLVDQFGQNAKIDFPDKVHSLDELLEISKKEQAALRDKPLEGRSKYNGWLAGPKLEATGYYRTEKIDGKWSLVDPEGYLFWSNGIANIRMANTSTITGYDFDHSLIPERKADDDTPEDSVGLNRVPKQAWPTRKVSSELRANMFTWLPDYNSEEAASFGYRREVHIGAIERGETFSFYRANLARKFGTQDEQALMSQWRDTTIKRMHTWGFTSFGNWVDPSYYQMDRLPYFANGWIIGDFKTVSSANDYWGPMPDPFDPVFGERVKATVKQIADEVQDNPWCVGVFIDNEKSWGTEGSPALRYGIAINGLKLDAAQSPLKAVFVDKMKAKYKNIASLNKAWAVDEASWADFAKGLELESLDNKALLADLSDLLFIYADSYFKQVDAELSKAMPNHMYMGPRFAHWAMTPEVRAAAAQYVDVMSYNYYRESINDGYWAFLEDLDMPSIIGEFHNGSMDSGLLNPGLLHAEDQADRGRKYQDYVYSALDNPYYVGTHWFQYIDSPLTGRAYDGENYNVGFVAATDIPYQPLVDAVTELNETLYERRFGE